MTLHPRVHEQLTHILVRHYGCEPRPAAKAATKLVKTLQAYGLDIVAGDWMNGQAEEGGPPTWENMAWAAENMVDERNGIKPWNPPELQ